MKCPFCGRDNTRVIDSRPSDDNNAIRRRRVCDVCGKRFTTYEKVETIPLIVIKKDNNREPYDRSKIELVMNKLKDLDAVAYVRFASVYREFKDVNTFFDELRKAVEKKKK